MKDQATTNRILKAASEIFCDKGFKGATIRDICTKADVNVAAINYHFGDKIRLYDKVLQHWLTESIETGTHTQGITKDSSPEERLRAYLRAEIMSFNPLDDPDNTTAKRARHFIKALAADNPNPGLCARYEVFEQETLIPIIKAILAPIEDQQFIQLASCSATAPITQDFMIFVSDPTCCLSTIEEIEERTDFHTIFVLAGLKALKDTYYAK